MFIDPTMPFNPAPKLESDLRTVLMEQVRDPRLAEEAKRMQPYCIICGSGDNLRAHHIKSLAQGGADALWNMDVVCEDDHQMAHSNPALYALNRELTRLIRRLPDRPIPAQNWFSGI